MFQRLAHLLGFKRKDDALAKRLAQLTSRNSLSCRQDNIDFVTHIRAGFGEHSVVGGSSVQKDTVRQAFLESYARSTESTETKELVGAGKN